MSYREAVINRRTGGICYLHEEAREPIAVEPLEIIRQSDVQIKKALPGIRLIGIETGGREKVIRENAGAIEIYDVASGSVDMNVLAHASRHVAGGDDPISGLTKAQLATNTIRIEIAIPLGYIPTDLATDSTGVKFETKQYLISSDLLACAKSAYFESDLQQLTGGAVDLELYDYTAGAVRASLSLSATTKRARSADIRAGLVAENSVGVRFNVTEAGATGSVGGGCSPVLIIVIGIS